MQIDYTGHPFVDVGIAAITAFAEKQHPSEVTADDLAKLAAYIREHYVRPPLRGHLTMAFTSNAWFSQDAYNPYKPDLSAEEQTKRTQSLNAWANRHLQQWQEPEHHPDDETCIFTGLPAVAEALSGSLKPGRAARSQIPMLQSDGSMNFFTEGIPGLPISGQALLALQFFPLACAKCGVGLLAVHADQPELTYAFALDFWRQNQQHILQAQQAEETKMPGAHRSPRTLLIETLLKIEERRKQEEEPVSLSAYNFNNGKSPSLVIYHLPLETIDFLQHAGSGPYRDAWQRLVQENWERPPKSKSTGKRSAKQETTFEPRRNYLYEDVFELPHNAASFLRTYFVRIPRRTHATTDPEWGYTLRGRWGSGSWSLLELFLRKVIRMEQARIEQIRTLGDGLAVYVRQQGRKKFFRSFFNERSPWKFRGLLIRANVNHVKAGNPPLFTMDHYIDIFEEAEEMMRPDWQLARDLVMMRMIEQLQDWLQQDPDILPFADTEENEDAEPSS